MVGLKEWDYNMKRIGFKTIIVLLLLLGMGSVFSVLYPGIVDIITLILCFFYVIIHKRSINKRLLSIILWVGVIYVFSAIITHTPITKYVGVYIRALAIPFVFSLFDNRLSSFKQSFVCALKIIAVLGIINFLLVLTIPNLFVPVQTDGYLVNTLGFIFNYNATTSISSLTIYRNQGIFWEPGLLQIPMNFLLYNSLIEEKNTIKSSLLPIIVILSTLSTTGIIIMSLILFAFIIRNKAKFNLSTVVVSFAVVLLVGYIAMENVQEKFRGEESSSTAARTFDLYMGWNIAKEHPLFGIGLNADTYLAQTKDLDLGIYDDISLNSERGNTNTLLSVMCYFGIPVSLLFILLLYKQSLFEKRSLFFVVLMIAIFSEPLFGTMLLYIFLFSSFIPTGENSNKLLSRHEINY